MRWVFSRQIGLTLVAGLVAGVLYGVHAAVSALIGGGIGVLSGYAYIWRAMRTSVGDPKRIYRAQAAGEGYKFALTLLLFALVFKGYGNVAALPLFLTYVSTVVVYWIALLKQR